MSRRGTNFFLPIETPRTGHSGPPSFRVCFFPRCSLTMPCLAFLVGPQDRGSCSGSWAVAGGATQGHVAARPCRPRSMCVCEGGSGSSVFGLRIRRGRRGRAESQTSFLLDARINLCGGTVGLSPRSFSLNFFFQLLLLERRGGGSESLSLDEGKRHEQISVLLCFQRWAK